VFETIATAGDRDVAVAIADDVAFVALVALGVADDNVAVVFTARGRGVHMSSPWVHVTTRVGAAPVAGDVPFWAETGASSAARARRARAKWMRREEAIILFNECKVARDVAARWSSIKLGCGT